MKRISSLVLAGLILAGTASAASAGGWTRVGYDAAASRHNTQQGPIDASKWRLRWSKNETATRHFSTNPLILDDRIIVGGMKSDYKVYLWCYDLDGNQLWARRVGLGFPRETIDLEGGLIRMRIYYTRDEDLAGIATPGLFFVDPLTGNKVISIPEASGSNLLSWGPHPIVDGEEWRGASYYCCGWSIPDPVVGDGVALAYEGTSGASEVTGATAHVLVCAPSVDEGFCAFDIASGEMLWSARTVIYPTIVGDVVFLSCGDTNAICRRDLHTGAILTETADFTHGSPPVHWLTPPKVLGRYITGLGAPAVGGGVYFVSGYDTTLGKWVTAGIDVETGELLTRRRSLYGPSGGWHTAIANGYLVSAVPGLRVSTFDRS